MTDQHVVSKELAALLGVLSHPDRIQIIELLRHKEHNVSSLSKLLGISNSRVSQHLTLLRSHRLLLERHEGRRHYFRLSKPSLATWLIEGLQFLDTEMPAVGDIHSAVSKVRDLWSRDQDTPKEPNS